jgi:hypothetical protein
MKRHWQARIRLRSARDPTPSSPLTTFGARIGDWEEKVGMVRSIGNRSPRRRADPGVRLRYVSYEIHTCALPESIFFDGNQKFSFTTVLGLSLSLVMTIATVTYWCAELSKAARHSSTTT